MYTHVKLTVQEPTDWFNYEIVREGGGSLRYKLIHRDTRVVISEAYQGRDLETYFAMKLLGMFIKDDRQIYQFFAYCHRLASLRWAESTEARANGAKYDIEAVTSYSPKTFEERLEAVVSHKNTCSGVFKLCSFLLSPELEAKLGRDGLKNLVNEEAIGYPVNRNGVPVDLAQKALAQHFGNVHQTCAQDFTPGRKSGSYKSKKIPCGTFELSFFSNSGNWIKVDGRRICILEKHVLPPNYLKQGDRFTTSEAAGVWVVNAGGGRERKTVLARNADTKKTSVFFQFSEHNYMYCGSNFGVAGHYPNLRKVA